MHSCPECGQACCCNDDIDDIMWDDDSEESLTCEHDCGPDDDNLRVPGYEQTDMLEEGT